MKMNIVLKIIFITLVFYIALATTTSKATFNPGIYNPGSVTKEEGTAVFLIGGKILGVAKNIATVVAVVTIAIIGLKYMFGSIEQKAEYKSTLVPWLIGAILVVSISTFIDMIQSFAELI